MEPIDFKESNVVFAEHQDEYNNLPAYVEGPIVTTRWKPDWLERIRMLFGRSIRLQMLTFGEPLQPIKMDLN